MFFVFFWSKNHNIVEPILQLFQKNSFPSSRHLLIRKVAFEDIQDYPLVFQPRKQQAGNSPYRQHPWSSKIIEGTPLPFLKLCAEDPLLLWQILCSLVLLSGGIIFFAATTLMSTKHGLLFSLKAKENRPRTYRLYVRIGGELDALHSFAFLNENQYTEEEYHHSIFHRKLAKVADNRGINSRGDLKSYVFFFGKNWKMERAAKSMYGKLADNRGKHGSHHKIFWPR